MGLPHVAQVLFSNGDHRSRLTVTLILPLSGGRQRVLRRLVAGHWRMPNLLCLGRASTFETSGDLAAEAAFRTPGNVPNGRGCPVETGTESTTALCREP